MGTGEAEGEKRAIESAEAAIANPLLDDVSMKGAKAVLINITGGPDMTLFEVDEAANRIREEVDANANIIFGSTFDESLDGLMRVSLVATGIDAEVSGAMPRPSISLVHDADRGPTAPAGEAATPAAAPIAAADGSPIETAVATGNPAIEAAAGMPPPDPLSAPGVFTTASTSEPLAAPPVTPPTMPAAAIGGAATATAVATATAEEPFIAPPPVQPPAEPAMRRERRPGQHLRSGRNRQRHGRDGAGKAAQFQPVPTCHRVRPDPPVRLRAGRW